MNIGMKRMQISSQPCQYAFDGFSIHAGDYLGLCGSQLFGTTRDIGEMLAQKADRIAGEQREFVNIFYGADVSEQDAARAFDVFRKRLPEAELNLVNGGQPVYYYLISAE